MRIFQASTSVGRMACTTVNTTVNTALQSSLTWGGTLRQSTRSPRDSPVPTVDSTHQLQTLWGCTLAGNINPEKWNKDNFLPDILSVELWNGNSGKWRGDILIQMWNRASSAFTFPAKVATTLISMFSKFHLKGLMNEMIWWLDEQRWADEWMDGWRNDVGSFGVIVWEEQMRCFQKSWGLLKKCLHVPKVHSEIVDSILSFFVCLLPAMHRWCRSN